MSTENLKLFILSDEVSVFNDRPTCKTCENRQRWECNSKVFQYCAVRKSNRTDNGLLKIKCKDLACELYKPSE